MSELDSGSKNGRRPTDEILEMLKAAAAIVAADCTHDEAARAFGIKRSTFFYRIRVWRSIWEIELLKARIALATNGQVLIAAPPLHEKRRRPHQATRERIRRAVAMQSVGATREEIARRLGLVPGTVTNWQRLFPDLWQAELDRAMETAVEIIRAQAGSDTVLKDPCKYLRQALACERWARQKGRPLFDEPSAVTLRTFFRDYYLPMRLEDASARAIADYQTSLRLWALFTGDPPLSDITSDMLAKFRNCLRASGGRGRRGEMSNNSLRTHLNNVQVLLDKSGPADRTNRDGAGLLESPPWLKPPRKEYPAVRIVTPDQIGRVYLAAEIMDVPSIDGLPAAWWWWRALLVVCWNSGLRKRNLLDARFDWIDWETHRLTIPARKHKTRRGQNVYLNRPALEHLEMVRGDRELIFPWSGGRPFTRNEDSFFHRTFRRLQLAAGIPENETFGLHEIRRTVATVLWEHSPAAAQLQLGHTTMGTTQGHYVAGDQILVRALDKLPQPEAFGKANGA